MTKWTIAMICLYCMSSMGSHAQHLGVSPFNTIGGTKKGLTTIPVEEQQDTTEQLDMDETDMEEPQDTTSLIMPLSVALPLRGIHVNSPFGMRTDPKRRSRRRMHNGIDLKARYEDVFSILPGVVEAASYSTNGGYYVSVNHGVFVCSYLHLSKICVQTGQAVKAGERIAISGNTGKRTTGPHLHISCRWCKSGKYFDPKILLQLVEQELSKFKHID